MKKELMCTALALSMTLGMLAGCASQTPPPQDTPAPAQTESVEPASDATETAESVEIAEEVDFDTITAAVGPEVDLGPLLDNLVPLGDSPAMSTVLSPTASGSAVKSGNSATIDYSNTKDGYVMACWSGGGTPKLKVLVQGPSGNKYQYNLRADGKYEAFPLSDGNGSYTIGVYKNTSGTKYATATTCSASVKLNDEFAPFIRPNQYVNYTDGSAAVKKAAEICAGAGSNLDKVSKVYDFVVGNLSYDKQKAQTVQSGYLPNVDETLKSKKGICFDYAALMSAMLRSQGVPVKLVVGYTGNQYHAWINVYSEKDGWIEAKIYFDGNAWKLMDPTFASSAQKSGQDLSKYIGNGDNYKAKYLY